MRSGRGKGERRMEQTHTVNAIRDRVEVLDLLPTADGWTWGAVRKTWARVELTGKTNLFSKVGLGARDVAVTMRRQDLTLGQALRHRGKHLFLTSLVESERGWYDLTAAVVEPTPCVGRPVKNEMGEGNRPVRVEQPPITFPGVVTEKYLGRQRDGDGTHDVVTRTLVLVTPKAVELAEGDLVDLGGQEPGTYAVALAHRLDPWKNEYEITRKADG